MKIMRIAGCTRVIGETQGYIGLPLRDIVVNDSVSGPDTPAMQTAWAPSADEIEAIGDGLPIILTVLGQGHPPVMISVGDEEGVPTDSDSFQARVHKWMLACFGEAIAADQVERNDRFVEEALELAQSLGWTPDRAHALVDYVFGRPAGDPFQEVGGVMVTLAALCNTAGIDVDGAADVELSRVWTKIEKIRAKQAAKPTGSALPSAKGAGGNAT